MEIWEYQVKRNKCGYRSTRSRRSGVDLGQEEQVWIYGSNRSRRTGVNIWEYQVRRTGVDIWEYQVRRTGVDIWE